MPLLFAEIQVSLMLHSLYSVLPSFWRVLTVYLLLVFKGSLSLETRTYVSFNSKLLTPASS